MKFWNEISRHNTVIMFDGFNIAGFDFYIEYQNLYFVKISSTSVFIGKCIINYFTPSKNIATSHN